MQTNPIGGAWKTSKQGLGVGGYRSRSSTQTSLYRIVYHYYEQFERAWEFRYQQRYGLLRPEVTKAFTRCLDCGVYEHGCARVRCPDCNHSILVAFSCKRRGVCPSCAAKRGVLFGEKLHIEVLAQVPHRHMVFTVPKRIRPFFRHNRAFHGILFKAAWGAIQQESCSANVGAVMSLHTAGETLAYHPHIHALVTDVTLEEQQSQTWNTMSMKHTFELLVMKALWKHFDHLKEVYLQRGHQENTGFNVWIGDPFSEQDADTRMFMGRYLMRHPLTLSKIQISNSQIIINSDKAQVPSWRGQPLDFLARLSPHVPSHYERLERYYGMYSSRARAQTTHTKNETKSDTTPTNVDKPKKTCSSWARCIKLIYEVDPMECTKCGRTMKVIAFIQNHLEIQKLISSLGLPKYRAPPAFASLTQTQIMPEF